MKWSGGVVGVLLLASWPRDTSAQMLRGSDVLNKLTDDIITSCPDATGLDFQGGGSAGAENRMASGLQQVAPMSRFIAAGGTVCNFPDTSTAEGLRVATDRIAVLTSAAHEDSCDPAADASCTGAGGFRATPAPLFPACGTLDGDWKHALRLIYFGLNCDDGLNPQGIAGVRNCLDPDRLALVNTWGNLFENPSTECSGGGGDGSVSAGNCAQLRHVFRRDNLSPTADNFRQLVGANNSNRTGPNGYPFCNEYPALQTQAPLTGTSCGGGSQAIADAQCPLNTTCNCGGVFPCTATCVAVPAPSTCGNGTLQSTEECDDGNTANFDGCSAVCLKEPGATPTCSGELTSDPAAGAPGLPTQTHVDAYQDSDPLRRACAGTFNVAFGTPTIDTKMAEEVCSRDGTLGLLLPISVPQALDGVAAADLAANVYPTTSCRQGRFINGAAPVVKSGVGATRRFGRCPDGRTPRGAWWDTAERLARPGHCTAGVCTADAQCGVAGGSCVGGVCTSGNCSGNDQCGTSGGACGVFAAATCSVPATESNDARCINAKNNKPAIFGGGFPTPGCIVSPATVDGRVFNLTLRTASGGLRRTAYNGSREVIGAFYRLHTTRTLLGNGAADMPGTDGRCDDGVCCDSLQSSRQIGCLVSASSCSSGFAQDTSTLVALDPSATTATGNDTSAHAQSVNLFSSSQSLNCSSYPLFRYLYLNTMLGFEATTGTELALAKCYSGVGLSAGVNLTSLILASEFMPLNTGPACQDFTAEGACGDTSADACANNPAGIACQDDGDCGGSLTCVVTAEPGGLTKGNCQ